jgi:hypothetical protein
LVIFAQVLGPRVLEPGVLALPLSPVSRLLLVARCIFLACLWFTFHAEATFVLADPPHATLLWHALLARQPITKQS